MRDRTTATEGAPSVPDRATMEAGDAPVPARAAVVGESGAAADVVVPLAVGLMLTGLLGAAGAAAAVAAVALAAMLPGRGRVRTWCAGGAAGAAIGAAVLATHALPLPSGHIAHLANGAQTTFEGRIRRSESDGAGRRLVVEARRIEHGNAWRSVQGLVALRIGRTDRPWPPGADVRARARIRRPRNFGNPGEYDYAGSLARRGIFATAFVWDDRRLVHAPGGRGGFARVRHALRTEMRARVARAGGPTAGPFLRTVLLGERRALPSEQRRVLVRAGLAHVAAVSGLHLAVVAGAGVALTLWLARRSRWLACRIDVRRLAVLGGVPPALAYFTVAGGHLPAGRALAMYAAACFAVWTDRPADPIRALAAVACVMLLPDPRRVLDPSFGLSFASVLAIVLALQPTRARGESRATRWVGTVVVAPLRVTMAAWLATLPLIAHHFHEISLVAPLANLVVLPFLGPGTLVPGLLALPAAVVSGPVADLLLGVAATAAEIGLRFAARLAAYEWAAVATPRASGLEMALWWAALALVIARRRELLTRRAWHAGAVLVALVALADASYWIHERWLNVELRVTFLSVGQGDAAVVELPYGRVMVIDGGGLPGPFDPGARIIEPFLRARKIQRLDMLVLSHPQHDHYEGLAHLATAFRAREFWSTGARARAAGFRRLEKALATLGARRVQLFAGARPLVAPGIDVEVLHPPAGARALGVNDASLVLRLVHGDVSVLFTGDVEARGEAAIVARGMAPSTALKVAHHGSGTSTSPGFLRVVAPDVAVISAGYGNRFGFPAAPVVRRLEAHGAAVWRTDRDGAVRLRSDGRRIAIRRGRG